MDARSLIAAAYPIPHDEGCFLDPEFGEQAFENYLDDEARLAEDRDEDFDPDAFKPFCNCGTDELNAAAARFLEHTPLDQPTILAAIEMIKTVQTWGLSKAQEGPVELLRKHIIGNLRFMAGLGEDE